MCPERRSHEGKKKILHTRKPPHRHDKCGALNLRVECNVREQNRKFTTEIAAEHYFSAKRWLTSLHPQHSVEVGCQDLGIGVRAQGYVGGWQP